MISLSLYILFLLSQPEIIYSGGELPTIEVSATRIVNGIENVKILPFTPISKLKEINNDTVLLAALISTECKSCTDNEKMVIAQVVLDRTKDKNFVELYGPTVADQIFGYAQFSGAKDGLKGTKTGKYFRFDVTDKKWGKVSRRLHKVAKRALEGERVVKGKVRYFCNPELVGVIPMDTTFVNWVLEKPLLLPFPTKHKYRA